MTMKRMVVAGVLLLAAHGAMALSEPSFKEFDRRARVAMPVGPGK